MDSSWEPQIRELHEQVQRRQRWPRGPKKMADVVSALLSRRGYTQSLWQQECQQAWEATVGAPLAADSRVGPLRRGVLEITVRNSAVMQELSFQKKVLLQQLGRALPQTKISDLRFRVGALA